MARVSVRWFGPLKDQLPAGEATFELEPGETAAQLFARVFEGTPEVALPVAFAIDAVYAQGSAVVPAGSEVAFLPPVGGG
jgi:molybdopterin converting factor small subunit